MATERRSSDEVVVFDFETTGLSPQQGDRAIEIGAVKLCKGVIVERFQELMNPGLRIPPFITELTGIDNAMVQHARPCAAVMDDFTRFATGLPLVAHNAAFDRRFLEAECGHLGLTVGNPMACTMLMARRLYQNAPDHKLGTLVSHLDLPDDARHHRALADAAMAAHLYLRICCDLCRSTGADVLPFSLLQGYGRQAKHKAATWLQKQTARPHGTGPKQSSICKQPRLGQATGCRTFRGNDLR